MVTQCNDFTLLGQNTISSFPRTRGPQRPGYHPIYFGKQIYTFALRRMAAAKNKSSLKIHYAYHREGPLSFHPCYLTSITAIIGVIKRIWLHKSGFRSLPVSRELGNGGNTVERILSLGRLAGVRADARRVCSRWIMALQKSTEVEHGRLSPRWKEYGSLPGICFPRRKVSPSLIFLIVGELNRYACSPC